ncbi:hypothetical protein [Polynucleobacter sp. AP-Feld-500C-C5]|jgi:hypothetical protein|uniref:hypothetical protein n=1 Tax=Polynucleobacter sp. AP-Feld-500C-C5 TaxID=2576924 RepID=UPI001BFE384D|nr:hypothetical protein [Polynucleobacter sp. AP-Feld-500C-C5]MBT8542814.1 hypothetical protein [Polynucleobacter paneuropaeus]MBU3632000.1 hypothetical protein [Polynucleobacter sp. AP-Feld-500C-C5]QWD13587.1 hypothetical protein G6703_04945 [Polynucleobacter paneuropaeus]
MNKKQLFQKIITHHLYGPQQYDGREVFYDADKGQFWDPRMNSYLDHEVGRVLIDLYFGRGKAPVTPIK